MSFGAEKRWHALDALDAEDLEGSVFRSFAEEGFRPWDAWNRLRGILGTNGGSYGLVGARGAGKSWLMQRAVLEARRSGGIGLWFPSPSEYEPQPFLSALSDNFGNEIERRFGRRRQREVLSGTTGMVLVGVTATVSFLLYLSLNGTTRADGYTLSETISAVAVSLGVTGVIVAALRIGSSLGSRGRLLAEADTLRERIRYSQTLKETGEAGVSAGKGMLSFKSSFGRELV